MAINRLAGRIGDLLARRAGAGRRPLAPVAHADHRASPGRRASPGERERLSADVDELTPGVDEVIDEARRPVREGVGTELDAAAAVSARVAVLVGPRRGGGGRQ